MFIDSGNAAAHRAVYALLAGFLFLLNGPALALDPELDVNQYAHTAWRYRDGFVKGQILSIAQTSDGYLWFGTTAGLWRFDGMQAVSGKLPLPLPKSMAAHKVLADHDGAVWDGSSGTGLLHSRNGRRDRFTLDDGLSGNDVESIFEDREGNIWVATNGGLDRFRALPAASYSGPQALNTPGGAASVLPDRDGSVWIGTPDGLFRWQSGKMVRYRPPLENASQKTKPDDVIVPGLPQRTYVSLLLDKQGRVWIGSYSGIGYLANGHFTAVAGLPPGYIDSIVEDPDGNIWVAHSLNGLFRISPGGTARSVKLPFQDAQAMWRLAIDPIDGGLWGGFYDGRVIHLINGVVVAAYGPSEGLVKGLLNEVRVTPDGAVWVAREGGLSRIKNNRVETLNKSNGLPCDNVHASIEGDDSAIWIYANCGLLRISRADMDTWAAAADGGNRQSSVHFTAFGEDDGVWSYASYGSNAMPHLAKGPDGKLWFISLRGITVVDPRHLAVNLVPPPMHVDQITADKKIYSAVSGLRLPPLTRDLTITYAALSLAAPEKVHFRYKLDGRDNDWREVVNQRSVQYSNLAPGNYLFNVVASNNSGVWNNKGATLGFSVAPAYWQTGWFLALCLSAGLGILAILFQWRLRVAAAVTAREQEIARRHHETEVELAHANRLATMGQLTASLAHEVNQPLGAVLMNAQAAIRWLADPLENIEEVKKNLGRIVNDVTRAAGIVKRVRTMAKKSPENREDIAINEAIAEVMAMTASEAAKQQIVVREKFAPDLPAIRADRVELQQVVLNLLMNAIEATSSIKICSKEIIVETVLNASGELQVSVSDFGPGIPPDALDRIFQPFYTSKDSGLGMGLSICRTIIEAHEGRLWAGANVPHGAVFAFTLPVVPTELESHSLVSG